MARRRKTAVEEAKRKKVDEAELAFWEAIKESDNPDDYRAYLETYPDGRFAALARVRLRKLEGTQTAVVSARPKPMLSKLAPGTKIVYSNWQFEIVNIEEQHFDIIRNGKKQKLLFGLIQIGEDALQKGHRLEIDDSQLKSLRKLFPLEPGKNARFKMRDVGMEFDPHADKVVANLIVKGKSSVEFGGKKYQTWIIEEKNDVSRVNAVDITRIYHFSPEIGIVVKANIDIKNYRNWRLNLPDSYSLHEILSPPS